MLDLFCTNCGNELFDQANFCQHCGTKKATQTANHDSQTGHTNAEGTNEEVESHETEKMIKLFIGKNQDYFLSKWKQENSWNWAAFFFGIIYLGYRKMYRYIFITIGILLALDVVLLIMNPFYPTFLDFVVGMVVAVVLGLKANDLYKKEVEDKVASIEASTLSKDTKLQWIKNKGGTSIGGIFIALLLLGAYMIIYDVLFAMFVYL